MVDRSLRCHSARASHRGYGPRSGRRSTASVGSVGVLLAVVLFSHGCGREAGKGAGKGALEGSGPSPAAPEPSAVERATAQIEKQWYGQALRLLADEDEDTAEAVNVVLPLLDLPDAKVQDRSNAVKWLVDRRVERERIAVALLEYLPRATWKQDVDMAVPFLLDGHRREAVLMLCRSLAKDLRSLAAAEAPGDGGGAKKSSMTRLGMASAYAAALAPIASDDCVPLLLPLLPPVPLRDRASRFAAETLLSVLRNCSSPAMLEPLRPYLEDNNRKLIAPAALGVARIGTDEAVAALESRMQRPGTSQDTKRLLQSCLMYARHPKGRALLDEAIDGEDRVQRRRAADALAATAGTDDTDRFCTQLNNPDPFVRRQLLGAVPRMLPSAADRLSEAARMALAATRPRTALRIAEAIGDADLHAVAANALEGLRRDIATGEQLDRWLDRDREDLAAEYGAAKAGRESSSTLAGNQLITTYGGSYTAILEDTVRCYGRTGKIVRVSVREGCDKPVYGVEIGDPVDRVWEIHGGSDSKHTGSMECYRAGHGGKPIWLRFNLDRDGRVRSIDINRDER